jgi:hypothetical protein
MFFSVLYYYTSDIVIDEKCFLGDYELVSYRVIYAPFLDTMHQRCPSRLKTCRCRAAAFEKRSYRVAMAY